MKHFIKSNPFLLRYLSYFLLLLVIPTIVMLFIYLYNISLIQQKAYHDNLKMMESSATNISETFDTARALSYHLTTNPEFAMFLNMPNVKNNLKIVTSVAEAQKKLVSYTMANTLIDYVQLYSNKNGMLISSHSIAMDLNRYYGSDFSVQDWSCDEWKTQMLTASHKQSIYPAIEVKKGSSVYQRKLVFAHSVPSGEAGNPGGTVLIYIDEKELLRTNSALADDSNSFLAIINANNQLMMTNHYSAGTATPINTADFDNDNGYLVQRFNGVKYFICYSKISSLNWTYITATPLKQVTENMFEIQVLFITVIALTIVISFLLAIYSANKASEPIASIYNKIIAGKRGQAFSTDELGDEIAKLVKSNEEMKAKFEKEILLQSNALYFQLLTNDIIDKTEFRAQLKKIGAPVSSPFFSVFIVSLNEIDSSASLEEISAYKALVKDVLYKSIDIISIIDMDLDNLIMLVSAEDTSADEARNAIENSIQSCAHPFSQIGMNSISFMGTVVDDIMSTPQAYQYLRALMNFSLNRDNAPVFWVDRPGFSDAATFKYPLYLETNIIAALTTKDRDKIKTILQLLEENIPESARENKDFLFAILRTLSYLYPSVRTEFAKDELSFPQLKERFIGICRAGNDTLAGDIHEELIAYLGKNFCDPQISLTSVATHFNISESYLSRIFKQRENVNFSKYIEKLRVEEAERLIAEGNSTIQNIANSVGYNSTQVFRRAQKRYHAGKQ